MAFLVKSHRTSFLLVLNHVRATQMGSEQDGCFEEAYSISRRLCLEPLFLDTSNLKQILTMIARNK